MNPQQLMPDKQFMEVFRAVVPQEWMLNDNAQQHYRYMQRKISLMARLCQDLLEDRVRVCHFQIPSANQVQEFLQGKQFGLVLELWKAKNIRFDLANYGKTFKEPVDALTNRGYWPDDNWQVIRPVLLHGGGPDAWKDAVRPNPDQDGLPDQLSRQLMLDHGGKANATLLRMLAFK